MLEACDTTAKRFLNESTDSFFGKNFFNRTQSVEYLDGYTNQLSLYDTNQNIKK